jgi:hypothetical protein
MEEIDELIEDIKKIKLDENIKNSQIIIYRKNLNIFKSIEEIINTINNKDKDKDIYLNIIKKYINKLYMLDKNEKDDLLNIIYKIENDYHQKQDKKRIRIQ